MAPSQQSPVRIALWAHPRSISTAFERVFIERGDATVFHEPFSQSFFFSDERGHERFADGPGDPRHRYDRVTAQVLAPAATPVVFIKDMAFHLRGRLEAGLLGSFVNTFIVREPEQALASMYRRLPDFDWTEAGYEQLVEAFHVAVRDCGQPPIVVEADQLRRDPAGVLRAYCARVGIPFVDGALRWERREIELWKSWDGWHDDAERSTHILPRGRAPAAPLPARVRDMIRCARPYYDELARHALAPEAP